MIISSFIFRFIRCGGRVDPFIFLLNQSDVLYCIELSALISQSPFNESVNKTSLHVEYRDLSVHRNDDVTLLHVMLHLI